MKMTKGGFVLFLGIVCMLMAMGPRVALCEAPHEDIKQRVERLEKNLKRTKKGAGPSPDRITMSSKKYPLAGWPPAPINTRV